MSVEDLGKTTSRRRFRFAVGCVVALLLVALLACHVYWRSDYGIHDRNLTKFRNSYATLSHPLCTRRVKLLSEVGLLCGSGDHCDYFVGELREYSCSRRAITESYKGKTIANPISKGRPDVEVAFLDKRASNLYHNLGAEDSVNPMEEPMIDMGPRLAMDKAIKDMGPRLAGKNLYFVYVLAYGYNPGDDIRCY